MDCAELGAGAVPSLLATHEVCEVRVCHHFPLDRQVLLHQPFLSQWCAALLVMVFTVSSYNISKTNAREV